MKQQATESPLVDYPGFLSPEFGWRLWRWLDRHLTWRQENVFLFGRWYAEPRLSRWFGPAYYYSGLKHPDTPCPWPIRVLMSQVRQITQVPFDGVLITLYRNGKDHVGWHADNEAALGERPSVAVLSLGATRRLDIKPKKEKTVCWRHEMKHGNLIMMPPDFQSLYKHRVPKSLKVRSPRVSLSFRALGSI